MIRKYKGQLRDRIGIAINLGSIVIPVNFALTLTQHYTTSLLVFKYFLRNLVAEKWHIYRVCMGNKFYTKNNMRSDT